VLVYALVEAPDTGWGDAQTILLLAGSAMLFAGSALIESPHPAPLVPLLFLRSRTLVGANAVMLLNGTLAVGMPFVLTLYAHQVLGYSAVKFGVGSVVLALAVTSARSPPRPLSSSSASGRSPRPAWRSWARDRSCSRRSPWAAAPSHLLRAVRLRSRRRPRFRDRHGRGPCGRRRARVRAPLGPQQHRFADRRRARLAIATTVAVSRSADYLAANADAHSLVVLNEGFQSAFLALVVLAGTGMALALLLLGRQRKARREQLEPAPVTTLLWLHDPDGYLVVLASPDGESPWPDPRVG
jgi:hypothetical protein